MLLSFSEPRMLPYIRAGILERSGLNIGGARVKRQTIRRRGPVADRLLRQAVNYRHGGDLHLWWKSRTPMREHLGTVTGFSIYPMSILHWSVDRRIGALSAEVNDGIPFVGKELEEFSRADGFDSVEAFRDYFVPKFGDRFDGVLFKW